MLSRRDLLILGAQVGAVWATMPLPRLFAQPKPVMEYWLSPVVGDGTSGSPYRGIEAECNLDFRPDSTKPDGFMVCCGPVAPTDGRVTPLGNDIRGRSSANKQAFGSRFEVIIQADRLDDILQELFILHAGSGKWNRLQPTKGVLEIWLGNERIKATPVVSELGTAWKRLSMLSGIALLTLMNDPWLTLSLLSSLGLTLTENWNCADSTTSITCQKTWTNVGSGDWDLVGNRVRPMFFDGVVNSAREGTDLGSDDFYVQCLIAALSSGSGGRNAIGSAFRFQSGNHTAYCYLNGRWGDNRGELYKNVTGTLTLLVHTALSDAVPFTIKGEGAGSTLKGYTAGVLQTTHTDTSITTGKRGGVTGFWDSATSSPEADDWEASDGLGGGGSTLRSLRLLGVGR